MTFAERKLLILASWVATVAIAGIILTIETPDLWLLVGTLALAPAAMANWLWNAPEATLAEVVAAERAKS
jgi:hypothetical protein